MATATMAAEAGRFEMLVRLGYAARGVVYLLVGGLAAPQADGIVLRQPGWPAATAILAGGAIINST